MRSSRFAPKAGERHRAMVRSAVSIYEESMGRHLGFGRAVEISRIRSRLSSSGHCSQKQLRLVDSVVRARNNEAHFEGAAFGFDRAVDDVRLIADALAAFGLTQSSARVREIIAGDLQGKHEFPYSPSKGNPRRGGFRRGRLVRTPRYSNRLLVAVAIFLVVLIVGTLCLDGLGLGTSTSGTLGFCAALVASVAYLWKAGS